MSKYYVYSAYGESDEPYKPLGNIDKVTGEEINDPDRLKQRLGPFFTCSEDTHKPHFHYVSEHPEILPEEDEGNLIIHQLHMPGYDEHDARPKNNFSTMPSYNVATGWNVADTNRLDPDVEKDEDDPAAHTTHFVANHKYDKSTDNNEAFNLWHETCKSLFGEGATIKHEDKAVYYPGMEQPEEREEEEPEQPEEPEDQEEQEGQNAEQGLRPGERAYSIAFYLGKEFGDKKSPAFSRIIAHGGHQDHNDAENHLLDLANKYDMISQIHKQMKAPEDPDVWEDLFKRSFKSFDPWA